MENIYQKIIDLQRQNIKAALCTLVSTSGSTPRKSGSKMLVTADGSIFGTIGGGIFEKQTIGQAIKCIRDGESLLFEYILTPKEGMGCGGKATVFIEPLQESPLLIIFGAGHIGKMLAKMSVQFDFHPVLIDNRPSLTENFSVEGVELWIGDETEMISRINFNAMPYIAIMTSDHEADARILAGVIHKNYQYLGVIASKAKIASTKKSLIENKLATSDQLEKVNWPIGIGIRCETPEEIALSVMAKIIDIRRST